MFNTLGKVKHAMHVKGEDKLKTIAKLCSSRFIKLRWYSTAKPVARLDSTVSEMIENEEIKHRHHPGVVHPTFFKYPKWLMTALRTILKEHGVNHNEANEQANKLYRHLAGRHRPLEADALTNQLMKIKKRLEKREIDYEFSNAADLKKDRKVKYIAQQFLYNWSAMDYNKYNSILYLIARSVPDYAVLCRIFGEIRDRDKEFKPNTLFDFGSGIGTVLWATSEYWSESLKEHYCVDVSAAMNDLSAKLLTMADFKVKGLFHRQYVSADPSRTYDIVVSAYSLLELPDMQTRIETILKLWMKTEQYLVIVEHGTNAAFKVINEARDFILSFNRRNTKHPLQVGHVFAPCPHDTQCPTYHQRSIPCNFDVTYLSLPWPTVSAYKRERFCFVVLKKGARPEKEDWPRIVEPTIKRSGHVICRMCGPSGELKEVIMSKSKHGRDAYRCARYSDWGDRLPIHFETKE